MKLTIQLICKFSRFYQFEVENYEIDLIAIWDKNEARNDHFENLFETRFDKDKGIEFFDCCYGVE